jgi:hypothetical protein
MNHKSSADVADDKIAELRAVIREANELLGDYKRTLREAKEFFATVIPEQVEEVLNKEVKEGLESFTEAQGQAVRDAVDRIFKQFDNLANQLLSGTKADRRKGNVSIPDIVEERAKRESPPY